MTKDVLKWLDEIKKTITSLEKDLSQKIYDLDITLKKNKDLEGELLNLSKVSLVAGLTRQVDDKNHQIKLLEHQLKNYKKNSIKSYKVEKNNKFIVDDSQDSEEEPNNSLDVENGYQLITHENKRLLKDLETRKLYYIEMNGSKGNYAGKESKKGKIKLKN